MSDLDDTVYEHQNHNGSVVWRWSDGTTAYNWSPNNPDDPNYTVENARDDILFFGHSIAEWVDA